MSATDIALPPLSRPKVFRPPAAVLLKPETPITNYATKTNIRLLMGAGLVLLLLGMSIRMSPSALTENKDIINENQSITSVDGVNNMLPQPMADAAASTLLPEKAGKIIVLRGQSESIIGQMARIPAESEQITEVRPTSEVDKMAGHELLSIVGKY